MTEALKNRNASKWGYPCESSRELKMLGVLPNPDDNEHWVSRFVRLAFESSDLDLAESIST